MYIHDTAYTKLASSVGGNITEATALGDSRTK